MQEVYLSNSLEILAEALKKNLFSINTAFLERYVVAPSPLMKQWLALDFAKDPALQICMGIKFLCFEEALSTFAALFFQKSTAARLKEIELLLYLQHATNKSLNYCKNLATLFKRYGIYSKEPLEGASTQAELYREIFSNYLPDYAYFNNLIEKKNILSEPSIHFFGFHHISNLHAHFLLKLPSLTFYTLSPSQEFWSDFLTDKEITHFFSKKKMSPELRVEWENYLEDRHPLLANWGKVGRKWAFFMEETDLPTIEHYRVPTNSGLLGQLQKDLLELQVEKKSLSSEDDSLQIHSFPTPIREIQGLFNTICYLLHEKKLSPGDITVFAPDISLYIPYIQTYFGKSLPYKIIDTPQITDIGEAFRLLFQLEKKRWDPESVLELITHPLFKKRMKAEDRELLKKWIDAETIHFGFNLEHANALLKKSHCNQLLLEESKTWQAAFDRLFLSFTKASSLKFYPEIIHSEFFATISYLLRSLYEDLTIFYDETPLTLNEWINYLHCLYEAYFVTSEETEKLEEFRVQSGKFQERELTFTTLLPLLEDFLCKTSAPLTYEDCNQIVFASLLPGRILPARAVILIGMNEEAFPRKESFAPLDHLQHQKKKYYYPTLQESDRYLFLESLLSARDYFILSYIGKSPTDQKDLLPSSLVSELLLYLPPEIVVQHPTISFDPLYFQKSHHLLRNYSATDFQLCQIVFQPKKPSYFIPEFYQSTQIPTPTLPEGKYAIDIADLRKLLRYPIKFFLEKKLSLSIKNSATIEEFSLNALDRYHFRTLALQEPFPKVLAHFEKEGKLPVGSFKEVALLRLKREYEERQRNFQHLGIQSTEIRSENISYNFMYDEKRVFHFTGKIPLITKESLLVLDKCQFSTAIGNWSDFLLLNLLSSTPKNLFFEAQKISKAPFFKDAKPYLKKLIDYYFLAAQSPLPLLPEWLEPLLLKDAEKLEQKILSTQEYSWDASLHFAFKNTAPPAEHLIQQWFSYAHLFFQEIKDGWF